MNAHQRRKLDRTIKRMVGKDAYWTPDYRGPILVTIVKRNRHHNAAVNVQIGTKRINTYVARIADLRIIA